VLLHAVKKAETMHLVSAKETSDVRS
jgi:hypothetical protein